MRAIHDTIYTTCTTVNGSDIRDIGHQTLVSTLAVHDGAQKSGLFSGEMRIPPTGSTFAQ